VASTSKPEVEEAVESWVPVCRPEDLPKGEAAPCKVFTTVSMLSWLQGAGSVQRCEAWLKL
jgi:hypothetical protein